MSIRLLARDLYSLQKAVEQLERELETAPLDKRTEIEMTLRKTRAEKESVRRALDGQIGR